MLLSKLKDSCHLFLSALKKQLPRVKQLKATETLHEINHDSVITGNALSQHFLNCTSKLRTTLK